MKFEKLGAITKNLDSRRIPLNSEERIAKSNQGLYPYVGANNIVGYIDEYIFDEKILCVAEDGGSWGANQQCAVIYEGKTWVNNHAHVLVENGKANLEYLKNYLNYTNLNKHIKGATRGKLNKSILENILIPLPLLHDQLYIANLLSKAENLISQRKESIRLLDEFLKSTFLEIFGSGKKFEWKFLEEVASKEKYSLSSGPFGSNLTSQHYTDTGVIILRGTNITSGKLDLSNVKYIGEEKAIELKRSELKPKDVVIIAVGSSGKALLVPQSLPRAIMSQNFNKITPDISKVEPIYLEYCINDNIVQSQFKKKITDTVRTFLSLTSIKEIKIPVPPLELQTQFAQIVAKTEAIKTQYQQSLQELENLYGSLSQKAFKGELTLK